MKFGDKLKIIREQRNMTQSELAALLGTSKQVISRYENNQRSPKIDVVDLYAKILGLPLETFTNVNNTPEESKITSHAKESNETKDFTLSINAELFDQISLIAKTHQRSTVTEIEEAILDYVLKFT